MFICIIFSINVIIIIIILLKYIYFCVDYVSNVKVLISMYRSNRFYFIFDLEFQSFQYIWIYQI